jgi:CheY-like chemotaxis protein
LILIADDSPIIQRKAQRILQDEGFEVQTVSNGVAAIKKLPVMQPALVLADVSMPGKDGYEVCEFVKTSAGLRHVPVLLVGSDLEPYDAQRGARVRADGIIKKPFAPNDLIAMVRRFAVRAKDPASLSTPEETPVPLSPAPVQAPPVEIPAVPAEPAVGEGREEGTPSANASPSSHVADDIISNAGRQVDEHPENTPAGLPEPFAARGEPFPGFVLGEAPESGSELSSEDAAVPAPSASEGSPEAEESRPEEFEELISPPQPVDLTATENVVEPIPVFAELVPEPAFAPQPDLTTAEPAREVEDANAQEPVELGFSPQLVDLKTPEAVPEPAALVAEPFLRAAPESLPEPAAEAPETEPVAAGPAAESVPDTAPEPAADSPEARQEWGDLISSASALETSTPAVDLEWVYKVVHRVVSRMAPPVLAPEQVEELARTLTREIESEFGGRGGQTVVLPE